PGHLALKAANSEPCKQDPPYLIGVVAGVWSNWLAGVPTFPVTCEFSFYEDIPSTWIRNIEHPTFQRAGTAENPD
ncbi:MAG TPA: hypothetical protein VGL53_05025, partial [Bryobacteraceae bacterium]